MASGCPSDLPRPEVQRDDSAGWLPSPSQAALGTAPADSLSESRRQPHNVVVARHDGQPICRRAQSSHDVCAVISQPHSRRYDERLRLLIGYFHTVLDCFAHVDPRMTSFARIIPRWRMWLAAEQHADAPFPQIVSVVAADAVSRCQSARRLHGSITLRSPCEDTVLRNCRHVWHRPRRGKGRKRTCCCRSANGKSSKPSYDVGRLFSRCPDSTKRRAAGRLAYDCALIEGDQRLGL